MFVRHLSLSQFRSWATAELPLSAGSNVLIGANGAGKTNLAEALGYLSTLGSHRVSSDGPLIRHGAEQAIVRAAVVSDGRELLLEVELNAGRANRARINRAPLTRSRDLLGTLRTVLFAPEDLVLVRGDPGERRRFTDEVLIQRAPRFAGIRADYDRVLKQRVALLKSAGAARRGGDLSTLDVWDEHLAAVGASVTVARAGLLDELRPHVRRAYAELAPGSAEIDVLYRPSAALPDGGELDLTDEAAVRAALLAAMARRRQQEIDRGICLVGPHRDEVDLLLGPGPAKGYASHGESWSFALALRLGAFELLRADGVSPVLILDDVFAELDTARRDRLAALVADAEQVLLTAAVPADVPPVFSGQRFRVADEHIDSFDD